MAAAAVALEGMASARTCACWAGIAPSCQPGCSRNSPTDRGTAQLLLTIAATGRVSDCGVLQSSGSAAVDQALCNVMTRSSRWEAARDLQGRPLSVKIRYTAIWSKN